MFLETNSFITRHIFLRGLGLVVVVAATVVVAGKVVAAAKVVVFAAKVVAAKA